MERYRQIDRPEVWNKLRIGCDVIAIVIGKGVFRLQELPVGEVGSLIRDESVTFYRKVEEV